jgi:hypothetical protein
MKWYDDIISFGKTTEMIGYQTWIKVKHGMKTMKFEMNFVTNSVAAKQIILEITNELLPLIGNNCR